MQKGFTLIELMIVIAIIAILAAILIPNFLHARAESVTAACEGNEKQLATAEEEYSVDNGGAYASLSVLTTPYISTVITDPVKKGNAYTVTIPGSPIVNGSYQIVDAGGHDTTTTTSLTTTAAVACATCATIIYAQSSGIHGN
ncbi:MAG TPA: prepilin-type N-terminal cleavage/methylation domain-containing protein [Candidatus Eremiobacteraceae bacterium]|nr:prepilin-type N-terminal cleavage/methylation domain-containing protein [Candidatus Eremiobacteraceae bacterium]